MRPDSADSLISRYFEGHFAKLREIKRRALRLAFDFRKTVIG
jgi:hypothetical protein